MSYSEALEFLHRLRLLGTKLGLEKVRTLAAAAGNPQDRLRFVHVSGTNGKGSTCAFLESIYRRAGYRVGLYTSPHLVRFNERIQVNRTAIGDADLAAGVESIRDLLPALGPEPPTFFEVATVLALLYFERAGCDLVIWETGMGGRLDATNLVHPEAAVITQVGWDHQQHLGNTLAQIAREKAGILKPGVPAITGAEDPEALEVIRATAAKLGCPLREVRAEDCPAPGSLRLGLAGIHQRQNAAVALAAVEAAAGRFPVTEAAVWAGLETAHWPGRMERRRLEDGRELLLDGAHNLPGVEALRQAMEPLGWPPGETALILGILKDKAWRAMCRELAPLAGRILTVPVSSDRTADPAALAQACRESAPGASVETARGFSDALKRVQSHQRLLVTGSLYLVGEALAALEGAAAQPGLQDRLTP